MLNLLDSQNWLTGDSHARSQRTHATIGSEAAVLASTATNHNRIADYSSS